MSEIVKRDAAATRARIAAAARAEFAAWGIAGARVDRIAAAAGANKNLIYVYFGSKEQLFDAVFAAAITELVTAVPIDTADLPGYAVALFEYERAHPELSRLARWQGLERPATQIAVPEALIPAVAKIEAIEAAQRAGTVNPLLPATLLMDLLHAIVSTWSDGSPLPLGGAGSPDAVAAYRAAVREAVQRLTAPPRF